MMRTMVMTLLVGAFTVGGAATAAAAANPAGTGPPNQSCQTWEQPNTGAGAPGHSGTSPGSAFDEAGYGSVNGGTGGNAYTKAGAPSQYDVACYQVNNNAGHTR